MDKFNLSKLIFLAIIVLGIIIGIVMILKYINGKKAKVEGNLTEKSQSKDIESVTEKRQNYDLDEKFSGYMEKIVKGVKKFGNVTSHKHISTMTHEKEVKAIEEHNNTVRVGLGVSALVVVMVIIAIVVLTIYKFKNKNGNDPQPVRYNNQNGISLPHDPNGTANHLIDPYQMGQFQSNQGPYHHQIENGQRVANSISIPPRNQIYGPPKGNGNQPNGPLKGNGNQIYGHPKRNDNQIYEVVIEPLLSDIQSIPKHG